MVQYVLYQRGVSNTLPFHFEWFASTSLWIHFYAFCQFIFWFELWTPYDNYPMIYPIYSSLFLTNIFVMLYMCMCLLCDQLHNKCLLWSPDKTILFSINYFSSDYTPICKKILFLLGELRLISNVVNVQFETWILSGVIHVSQWYLQDILLF